MTFNDLIEGGCTVQGSILVTIFDGDHDVTLYEGCGEDLGYPGDDWGEREITYVYYDELNRCLRFELGEE